MSKKRLLFTGLIIVLALLPVLFGLKAGLVATAPTSTERTAPNFKLPDPNGKMYELKTVVQQNKVTLVNFWATWCPPCRNEIPELVKLYEKYRDQKLTLLAVDLEEDPGSVKQFAQKNKMSFPVLTDTDGKVAALYKIYAIPHTFVINSAGKIVDEIEGSTDLKSLEELITPLLKAK